MNRWTSLPVGRQETEEQGTEEQGIEEQGSEEQRTEEQGTEERTDEQETNEYIFLHSSVLCLPTGRLVQYSSVQNGDKGIRFKHLVSFLVIDREITNRIKPALFLLNRDCIKYCINKKQSIRIYKHIFIMHVFQNQSQLFIEIIIPSRVFKSVKS